MPLYQPERLSAPEREGLVAASQLPPSEAGWKHFGYSKAGSRALHHFYIGSEHLVLGGAITEEIGPVFEQQGAKPEDLRGAIRFLIGEGGYAARPDFATALTQNATAALKLGADRGQVLGSKSLEPELIVLGLIDHGQGTGIAMLESLGVRVSQLETAMVRSLRQRVMGK